ncbi:MAG: TldD/PmbA family protein, partial [Omnitrophica WOR_2 bacterium]
MMRERLVDALHAGKTKAEYIDIRIEDESSTAIWFHGPELDEIGSSRTLGGIVRALHKGGWGYSTFNDLNNLPARVNEACEAARMVGQGETRFAPVEPVVYANTAHLEKDFREVPLPDKKALAEGYNRLILGYHPKIVTSTMGYGDSFKKIWFATSEGTYIEDEQPNLYIFGAAVAREEDLVQSVFEMDGGFTSYTEVEGFEEKARNAAKRAVELLSAPVVKGGVYPVVVNPGLAGVFAHEAFGHLSEAD